MRVLIMGAGVAGTVVALAAQKAGLDPVVYEAYQESAGLEHGIYLGVAVNGLAALRVVDAHQVVLDAGFPSGRMSFFSGTGKKLGAMAMGPVLDDGLVTHTIRRSDLYRGLAAETVRRGIRIEHGKRLTGARPVAGGGVVVEFADGTTAEGDVLVGADGVHSVTRKVIDPANPGPRYTGLGNTGGFARGVELDAEPGSYVMVWGKRCFFGYTVSPDGEIWWFANPPSKAELSPGELRAPGLRERLVALLAVDRTPGAAIVEASAEFKLSNQYDLPAVPTWSRGPMVIVGDAAHAVSPASGQGVSLACEDAVTLARCLRDAADVPAALAAYELERRSRVERVVKWGAGMNNTKKQGPVGRVARDLVLPLILKKGGSPAELARMNWLFAHQSVW
ncbi:FAD-dependent oxidoreductase [Kribbella kalugense]|uniref:2-polyprenyl-6-methoxyphenol hydroxylase-like FAD-dependent oxidoreductase n=1 Tax=Kribbella kalugense TaxID=2512221 RepID=A0A4R7ZLH3_9ACTN|nr:NAD(P)/FAD-dependent oxidoreductase [Kribbella kalugense]TDW18667.1 2-polyprenyl-6-methoxyphenol hydroxylase-like FAD-dependent oxidoreductase [Kribbella kalugense]